MAHTISHPDFEVMEAVLSLFGIKTRERYITKAIVRMEIGKCPELEVTELAMDSKEPTTQKFDIVPRAVKPQMEAEQIRELERRLREFYKTPMKLNDPSHGLIWTEEMVRESTPREVDFAFAVTTKPEERNSSILKNGVDYIVDDACPDCHDTRVIQLLNSTVPCKTCGGG